MNKKERIQYTKSLFGTPKDCLKAICAVLMADLKVFEKALDSISYSSHVSRKDKEKIPPNTKKAL